MTHGTLQSNLPLIDPTTLRATEYFEDYLYEVALVGDAVTNANFSTVSVTSPNASDLATAITLTNELKGDVNTLVTNLNSAITQLNALLASLRAAEKIND